VPIVPLFGSGTRGKSSTITDQRRINLYAERYGVDSDKTQFALFGRPGLTQVANGVADAPILGTSTPVRGFSEVWLSGVTQSITMFGYTGASGLPLTSGTTFVYAATTPLRTTSGAVGIAQNQTQILAVDGVSGYIWVPPLGVTTDLFSTTFPVGARTVCFIAGRFVVENPAVLGQFNWSDVLNGLSWPVLNFATAESASDPLVCVAELAGELVLLGTFSIEFWAPTGGTDVFRRIGGSGIEYGLTARDSVQKINGGLCFLGRSKAGGERQVFFISGHTCNPISSPDVTIDINTSANPDAATGCAFVVAGHAFYVLNLPETSWAYDFTSQVWSEWQTDEGRWCIDHVRSAFGYLYASDYRDGRIYKIDVNSFSDGGDLMAREVWTRHVFNPDLDRMSIDEVQLDMEVGVGLNSGQGSDPQVMMSTSGDGAGPVWARSATTSGGRFGTRSASPEISCCASG